MGAQQPQQLTCGVPMTAATDELKPSSFFIQARGLREDKAPSVPALLGQRLAKKWCVATLAIVVRALRQRARALFCVRSSVVSFCARAPSHQADEEGNTEPMATEPEPMATEEEEAQEMPQEEVQEEPAAQEGAREEAPAESAAEGGAREEEQEEVCAIQCRARGGSDSFAVRERIATPMAG